MSASIILMSNKPITKTKYSLNKIIDIGDLEYDFHISPLVYQEEFILNKLFIKKIKYSLRNDLLYLYSVLEQDSKGKEYKMASNALKWFFCEFIRKQLLNRYSIEMIVIMMSDQKYNCLNKKSLKEKIVDIDRININEFFLEYNTIYKFISNELQTKQ